MNFLFFLTLLRYHADLVQSLLQKGWTDSLQRFNSDVLAALHILCAPARVMTWAGLAGGLCQMSSVPRCRFDAELVNFLKNTWETKCQTWNWKPVAAVLRPISTATSLYSNSNQLTLNATQTFSPTPANFDSCRFRNETQASSLYSTDATTVVCRYSRYSKGQI